jgi:hypothetical protein
MQLPVVTTAYRITEDSGAITFSSLASGGWSLSVNNTFSVHAKEDDTGAKRYIFIGLVAGNLTRWAWAIFDLHTQEIITRSDGIQNAVSGIGIDRLNDGWNRIFINFNSPLAAQQVSIISEYTQVGYSTSSQSHSKRHSDRRNQNQQSALVQRLNTILHSHQQELVSA